MILILIVSQLMLADSPFETPKPSFFNTSVYDSKLKKENKQASKNKKITCRYVCDKKLYKEQQISKAVTFYKNSQDYKFISDTN